MSVILSCYHQQEAQPYIGVDSTCYKPAIFCVQHDPHRNKQGLIHQMMPLTYFKRIINEKKFKMSDKVSSLVDQYSNFMDELIKEITQLKLRKTIQLNMLWLRQLSNNQEQYQSLRKIYRNDYSGLSCKDVHWLYYKLINNEKLDGQNLHQIPCYKEICKVMDTLSQSVKGRLMISQKIMQLQGMVQKGELLKKALPDRKIFKENTKEILLQTLNPKIFDIKYNKITIKQTKRNFQSIFSKYPLLQHTNYHLFIKTKYSNILLGLCNQSTKKSSDINDLHYSQHSITFNCSNGCLYRDGMFQSGSATLTKGQKQLQLILRITDTQMMILLGKNVVCRAEISQFKNNKLYLHLLMRTQGDLIEIDRDKFVVISSNNDNLIEAPKRQFSQVMDQSQKLSNDKIDNQIYQSIEAMPIKSLNLSIPIPIEQEQSEIKIDYPENSGIHADFCQSIQLQKIKSLKESFGGVYKIEMNKKPFSTFQSNSNFKSKIKNRDQPTMKQSIKLQSVQSQKIMKQSDQFNQSSDLKFQQHQSIKYSGQLIKNSSNLGIFKKQVQKQQLLNPAFMLKTNKSDFQMSNSSKKLLVPNNEPSKNMFLNFKMNQSGMASPKEEMKNNKAIKKGFLQQSMFGFQKQSMSLQ